jgi:TolA-binding protein
MKGTDFASIASNLDSNADNTEIVDALTEMATAMDDLEGRVDELEGRVDDLEDQLREDLRDEKEQRGQADAQVRSRVHDLEDRVDSVEGGVQTSETTIQSGDLTPIERLSAGGDVSEVTTSASVERAVTIFENITDWGQKAPKGHTLKPADNPLSLLEAERDESLAWRQWYRAAETLEALSKGAVTFFDSDRHGKMICLHEQSEVFDRVTSETPLSASSAATTS